MTKLLGRRNKLGKMSSSQNLALVNLQLIVLEVEEEGTSIKIQQHIVDKVMIEVKAEGKISVEETVLVEATFKAEETIKAKVEDKLKEKDKVGAKDGI